MAKKKPVKAMVPVGGLGVQRRKTGGIVPGLVGLAPPPRTLDDPLLPLMYPQMSGPPQQPEQVLPGWPVGGILPPRQYGPDYLHPDGPPPPAIYRYFQRNRRQV